MELVEGHTLRGAVSGSMPVTTRVTQLADVARALAGAHRRGLVHRDIKPENVMVRDDGVIKVLDFGIARRTTGDVDPHARTQTPALPTLTLEGVKLGTPVYMAPEQIRGDALDGRADQFSWGVLAYELLAGRLPWRGASDAMAVMASVLTDPVDAAPLEKAGVAPAVQQIVLRALHKRPEDRFASMDDVLRALEAAARGEPLPAEKAPPGATEAQRFSTRRDPRGARQGAGAAGAEAVHQARLRGPAGRRRRGGRRRRLAPRGQPRPPRPQRASGPGAGPPPWPPRPASTSPGATPGSAAAGGTSTATPASTSSSTARCWCSAWCSSPSAPGGSGSSRGWPGGSGSPSTPWWR